MDVGNVSRAAKLRLILTEPNLHTKNLQQDIRDEWARGARYFQGNDFQGNHPWKRWYLVSKE